MQAALDRIRLELAARESELAANVVPRSTAPEPDEVDAVGYGDDPLRGVVENWSATVAYYADGMNLDDMSGDFVGPGESSARVRSRPPSWTSMCRSPHARV